MGCGSLALLAFLAIALLGGGIYLLSRYLVIVPRESLQPKPTPVPAPVVVSAPSPTPAPSVTPTPEPTVDLAELPSRMQDWPEEVALMDAATFPGDVVAPLGTVVKLISAGPEVEVEYEGQEARIPASQTDLVARVLSHRAEVARELETRRQLMEARAQQAKAAEDARVMQIERIYGKPATREDAYYAIKTYLKGTLKEPDSLQVQGISNLYPTDFNGRKCWATKVQFIAKDAVGAAVSQTATAYLSGDNVVGFIQGE
jgi:hypothetical protein